MVSPCILKRISEMVLYNHTNLKTKHYERSIYNCSDDRNVRTETKRRDTDVKYGVAYVGSIIFHSDHGRDKYNILI